MRKILAIGVCMFIVIGLFADSTSDSKKLLKTHKVKGTTNIVMISFEKTDKIPSKIEFEAEADAIEITMINFVMRDIKKEDVRLSDNFIVGGKKGNRIIDVPKEDIERITFTCRTTQRKSRDIIDVYGLYE